MISLLGYGAGARQDETGTLRNDIAECRQRVAMAAADLRAMGAAGVEDEVVVDEAVRCGHYFSSLSTFVDASLMPRRVPPTKGHSDDSHCEKILFSRWLSLVDGCLQRIEITALS